MNANATPQPANHGNSNSGPRMIIPVRPAAGEDTTPAAGRPAGLLRRTLGKNLPSRRTFGRGNPSRRTFGINHPSRRTFGVSHPSRRTFGISHP